MGQGQSDLKGKYYTMNDCRLGPLPSRPIPMICAGTSDAGMKFAAKHCAYNFCSGNGEMNNPRDCADSVARLNACTTEAGTKTKALALTMIIADETDEAAMAKWEHYKAGVDLDALDWSRSPGRRRQVRRRQFDRRPHPPPRAACPTAARG